MHPGQYPAGRGRGQFTPDATVRFTSWSVLGGRGACVRPRGGVRAGCRSRWRRQAGRTRALCNQTESAGSPFTILMVPTLTVIMRFTRSSTYRGSDVYKRQGQSRRQSGRDSSQTRSTLSVNRSHPSSSTDRPVSKNSGTWRARLGGGSLRYGNARLAVPAVRGGVGHLGRDTVPGR